MNVSENFKTIFVEEHFQFLSSAEFIGQDRTILPEDQPIRLQKAGQDE